MAANTTPIFTKEGQHSTVLINAANAAADGSGTLFDLITGGADGSRIEGVRFISSQVTVGAIAAKVCRIFITDAAGANPRLIAEAALSSATRSATVTGSATDYFFAVPIVLQSGQKIQVCQSARATSADDTVAYTIGAGKY